MHIEYRPKQSPIEIDKNLISSCWRERFYMHEILPKQSPIEVY